MRDHRFHSWNIEGVIGNKESVSRDSFSDGKLKGHVYTRPKNEGDHVPEILLGDHKKIEEWKLANSLWVTKQKRPDLFKQIQLSEKEWYYYGMKIKLNKIQIKWLITQLKR